jgi:hypothetical protein
MGGIFLPIIKKRNKNMSEKDKNVLMFIAEDFLLTIEITLPMIFWVLIMVSAFSFFLFQLGRKYQIKNPSDTRGIVDTK